MITADFELNRADDSGLRAAMIEAFRQRGIRPEAVGSLAVQSLLLEAEDTSSAPDPFLANIVNKLLGFGARQLDRNYSPKSSPERKRRSAKKLESPHQWIVQQNQSLVEPMEDADDVIRDIPEEDEPEAVLRDIAKGLTTWAKDNRARLKLHATLPVALRGFHPVHRIAPTGELLMEMIAHFVQTQKETADEDLGGLKYRAGVTLIANIDGQIRYLIHKPFMDKRKDDLTTWVNAFDEASGSGWSSEAPRADRIMEAFSARAMDRRRWR